MLKNTIIRKSMFKRRQRFKSRNKSQNHKAKLPVSTLERPNVIKTRRKKQNNSQLQDISFQISQIKIPPKPHANIMVSPFERNINDIFRYSTTKIALVIYTDIIVATLYQKHTLQIISTHQVKKQRVQKMAIKQGIVAVDHKPTKYVQ